MTNFLIKVLVKLLLGLWLMVRLAMGSFIIKIMRSPGCSNQAHHCRTYRTPKWRRYWTIVLWNNCWNLPTIIKIKKHWQLSSNRKVKWSMLYYSIYNNLYDCKQTTFTTAISTYLKWRFLNLNCVSMIPVVFTLVRRTSWEETEN